LEEFDGGRDLYRNRIVKDRGDSYVRVCPTAKAALERLARHHCYPPEFRAAIKGRVDGNASTREQYEALSVVFGELAQKEP
jgi:hypothetical protein